jgi:hypothetical protein
MFWLFKEKWLLKAALGIEVKSPQRHEVPTEWCEDL